MSRLYYYYSTAGRGCDPSKKTRLRSVGMNNIVVTIADNFLYFAKSKEIAKGRYVPLEMRSCNDVKVPLLRKAEEIPF